MKSIQSIIKINVFYHYFDRLEARFLKYDDSDNEIYHLIYLLYDEPSGLDCKVIGWGYLNTSLDTATPLFGYLNKNK